MKRILFVCDANVFRSVIAEFYFNFLASDSAMFSACSAGINAFAGDSACPAAKVFLEFLGILGVEEHRSTRVSSYLLQEMDLIFAMMENEVLQLQEIAPEKAEFIERLIPGEDLPSTLDCREKIVEAVENIYINLNP